MVSQWLCVLRRDHGAWDLDADLPFASDLFVDLALEIAQFHKARLLSVAHSLEAPAERI